MLWARRFPPETPVAGIRLGVADEEDETNRIRDLQLPDYRKFSLQETSLEEGFFNMAEEYKQLLRDYESLEKLAQNRNECIRYFEERHWKTRLKGALYFILDSFVLRALQFLERLRLKVSRKERAPDDIK